MRRKLFSLLFLSACVLLAACIGNDDDEVITPKPRAYYRLKFPEKKYKLYDTICPFTFETPVYSVVEPDKQKTANHAG